MTLKNTLHTFLEMDYIEKNNYLATNQSALLTSMLENIGSIDAELRDQYIYRTFHDLLNNQLLSNEWIEQLFKIASSKEFLLFNVGEQNTDSVFKRSASALLLTDILTMDAQHQILPIEMLTPVFKQTSQLLSLEKDFRAYVDGKGWAHSIATSADLITAVIKHPSFELLYAPNILQTIKDALWKNYVYTDDEDERFVHILNALIAKGLAEEIVIEWTEQLFDQFDMHLLYFGYNEPFFKGRTCTLNLMKTFYFSLKMKNKMPALQNTIYALIGKWFTLQ